MGCNVNGATSNFFNVMLSIVNTTFINRTVIGCGFSGFTADAGDEHDDRVSGSATSHRHTGARR